MQVAGALQVQALFAVHQATSFEFEKIRLPRFFETRKDVVTLRLKVGVSEHPLPLPTSGFVCLVVYMTNVRKDDQTRRAALVSTKMPGVKKKVKANTIKRKVWQMDVANRALCFAYRNPPAGQTKTPWKTIIKDKLVVNTRGKVPTIGAMSMAVKEFKTPKMKRGRKKGQRKTSRAEDRVITQTFHKVRPPGCGVDSREIQTSLPKRLEVKVSRRTVIRRLAEKGYTHQEKLTKADPGRRGAAKRMRFARKHKDKNATQWKACLQGVGDCKDFTHYPKSMRPKLRRLRARYTYMSKAEKKKPEFQRPKKWFPQKEYKKTTKVKLFGLTTSTGKIFTSLFPNGYSAQTWAKIVDKKLAPFLQSAFPGRRAFQLLLDGDTVFRAPEAKAAYKKHGITLLPDWPPHTPMMNPQENVWPWTETYLREELESEAKRVDIETFKRDIQKAVQSYVGADKLVGSMVKRVRQCLETEGYFIDS